VKAVILAGGRGTRLAPYTTALPKPLMPVGDMPILELLIRRLAAAGITDVVLAVGHLASLIRAFVGDEFAGATITYSYEDEPLGTAGPLAAIDGLDDAFLVMNGDLLTDLDFGALVATHRGAASIATVGTYQRHVSVDLGVVERADDGSVARYVEKPQFDFLVSMGVYVLEPAAVASIPVGQRFDLPDLVTALVARGERVATHEHTGYWLDIGRPDDYERAQADIDGLRARLLPDGG
jgi:NDP-sugar pyrophosphorylase family protein